MRSLVEAPMLAPDILLALLGTILAVVEIQIEGPHGWAEKLPTWRPEGRVARALSRAFGGKPVTGYHISVMALLFGFVHLPATFVPWAPALEGWALSRYLFLAVFWDFQWFVLNPHFGLRRFDAAHVWWHRRWAGPVPVDYVAGLALSALAGAWWPSAWLIGISVFALETALVVACGEILLRRRRR